MEDGGTKNRVRKTETRTKEGRHAALRCCDCPNSNRSGGVRSSSSSVDVYHQHCMDSLSALARKLRGVDRSSSTGEALCHRIATYGRSPPDTYQSSSHTMLCVCGSDGKKVQEEEKKQTTSTNHNTDDDIQCERIPISLSTTVS
mmetsp:Transcript_35114/g.35637  ORF Transcript_35114/g.35637 Transcript_35114/m.35637 type:complete len:144 (+) Transcript_35114:679-1110(+)